MSRACAVSECGRPFVARGFCGLHYKRFMAHGDPLFAIPSRFRHGHAAAGTRSTEYRVWASMLTRCYNPSSGSYKSYGGRGIAVCAKWRDSFEAFLRDMGYRPAGTTLDRIDNDKGYSLENCRWATDAQQRRNSRRIRNLTIDGVTQCVVDWAAQVGRSQFTIYDRLNRGLDAKTAVFASRVPRKRGDK